MSTPSSKKSVPDSALQIRRAQDSDWEDIFAADARAFLMTDPLSDDEQEYLRSKVADADVVVVRDTNSSIPDPLVGAAMFYRMALTLPGGAVGDAAGLSWVSVAATHRRRGILRMMISELFDQWEREEHTFAILTASEATIYERFGFGPTCFADRVDVTIGRAELREPHDGTSPVVFGTPDEIAARVPDIHARWAASRSGALGRPASWWAPILADQPSQRPAHRSALHYLLHADGYASYRINNAVEPARGDVEEFFAVTEQAHSDLWRVLTGFDLLSTLRADIPVDDPLSAKLTDMRAVNVRGRHDKMWLRILDVAAALRQRRYRADLDVVLDIADDFRGHGGTFALTVRNGGGIATRTDNPANVRMDVSVLGMIYLGGVRPATLAAAGRLWTDSEETLVALDRAFATDRAPFSGTFF